MKKYSTNTIVLLVYCTCRYLQAGSYPVVSPDGGAFPEGMRPLGRYVNLTFNPENGEHSVPVTSPLPGPWFMLAHYTEREGADFAEEVRIRAAKL